MSWYHFFRFLTWIFANLVSRIHAEGHENIPASGPYVLLCTHQSAMDPIYVQTQTKRIPRTFTKSTQFTHPFFRWVLPRLWAIPTRRYRVDPQAVRTALRTLDDGEGVCIYPEGERSWDGTIQPLRRGTVRFVLKADVPVICCGLTGSFDVWSRWGKAIKRHDVWVRFGEPMHFGPHDSRQARDRGFQEAYDRIVAELDRLSSVPGTNWEDRPLPAAESAKPSRLSGGEAGAP